MFRFHKFPYGNVRYFIEGCVKDTMQIVEFIDRVKYVNVQKNRKGNNCSFFVYIPQPFVYRLNLTKIAIFVDCRDHLRIYPPDTDLERLREVLMNAEKVPECRSTA